MKKVVTVTLGSSQQDFEFKTRFLGQDFSVRRMGADMDTVKAWELMRRQQAFADAIGAGEISDHYQVGLRTITNKETERLTNVVTRVPVTTTSFPSFSVNVELIITSPSHIAVGYRAPPPCSRLAGARPSAGRATATRRRALT